MKALHLIAVVTAVAAVTAGPSFSASAGQRSEIRVERLFPAAGELTVGKIAVRVSPNPSSHTIKVMTQFRDDYRIQEIFAVATRLGSDHRPWYKISIPMRPNGTMG